MLPLIIQGILLYGLLWACWRILRQYVAKTALDNIPGPPSPSFFIGNFQQLFAMHGWDFHSDIAAKYGSVVKVKGLFGDNQLYVFDPKALHHVLVKDQYIYEKTSQFNEVGRVLLGNALFVTQGEHHRRQKKLLNPVFSTAHLREMVPVFYSVTHRLRDSIAKMMMKGPQEIDLSSWMSRTALELIGQSGFGYSFDTLAEDAIPNPNSGSLKRLAPAVMRIGFFGLYFPYVANIGTPKLRRFIVDLLPWKDLHDVRDIVDTLHNASLEVFESKKRALLDGDEAVARQIGHGKDILSILMKANMGTSEKDQIGESELITHVGALTFAAVDTTSNALSRTLQLLAQHPDIQEKLRREVTEARAKTGNLSYDELVSLPYLNAVCRETLRLYPPLSYVDRTTRGDITLPLSKPLKGLNGEEIHEIPVPNNTNIIVSIVAANRNPEIWGPDSFEWIPERWLAPLPSSVSTARVPGIYSHLMTFSDGGRACIGFKFAELQIKVVLSVLIESFRFAPSHREIFWQTTGMITAPTVVGEGREVQLPLLVSRV